MYKIVKQCKYTLKNTKKEMIFTGYTKNDSFYVFESEDKKVFAPISSIVIVDDESGSKTVRNIASRKNIGVIMEPQVQDLVL